MSNYRIEMTDGTLIKMPRYKARSPYDYISVYGIGAILHRVRVNAVYRRLVSQGHSVRAVIMANGDRVTQF